MGIIHTVGEEVQRRAASTTYEPWGVISSWKGNTGRCSGTEP
jgi:hypothetical protein